MYLSRNTRLFTIRNCVENLIKYLNIYLLLIICIHLYNLYNYTFLRRIKSIRLNEIFFKTKHLFHFIVDVTFSLCTKKVTINV